MGDTQFNGTPEEWDALVQKNKKKQTAVEWLVSKLYDYPWDDISDRRITEALEMEKQQIIHAHISGFYSPPFGKSRNGEAEKYYNETYEKL